MASVSSFASTATAFRLVPVPRNRCRPVGSFALVVLSDLIAIVFAIAIAQFLVPGYHLWDVIELVLPVTIVSVMGMFAIFKLYPGVVTSSVKELRSVALALAMSLSAVVGIWRFTPRADVSLVGVFVVAWVLLAIAVPLARSIMRQMACRLSWWGVPVAVFYTGPETLEFISKLQSFPEAGLVPVAVLAADREVVGHELPVLNLKDTTAVRKSGVRRAIIALSGHDSLSLLEQLEEFESVFPRLMVVHGSTFLYSLAANSTHEICGSLAVHIHQSLVETLPRIVKRMLDIAVVCLIGPAVLPMIILLTIIVKLDSPGPVFFGHRRIGRGNSTFKAWKIRTMYTNSDHIIRQAIESDAKLEEEWVKTRKLRKDPRISRIGRFLRRTSLDELPQLWNVFCGDMSLVGPRPIVEEEVSSYGRFFSLYCKVSPGITGLWQVSGRNSVSMKERVQMDCYYVRNWSPWLDLHILARTAVAVLNGRGAY